MEYKESLSKKLKSKKAKIGLIGVGYVGSALGIGAAGKGFKVVGYGRRKSSKETVQKYGIKNFTGTNEIKDLASCDVICICVPTPVLPDKTPDVAPLTDALKKTLTILKKGMLVIIESSIAPGMTRSIAVPILEKSGFELEKDYFLSFSPERIDPGNKNFDFTKIPKVVAGYGKNSLELAVEFYTDIVVKVHPVSSLEVAEMSKILENTFRLVNISMINQLTEYTKAIGIDIWEVIEAAGTKPFGFLPHYPGPGIGGHCIPVDPYYLLEDAKKKGVGLSIIEESGKVNDGQPGKVVNQIVKILAKLSNGVKKNKVMLIGVTYKQNVPDTRETPAERIWELLEEKGINVSYHDPHVSDFNNVSSMPLISETVKAHDLIVIITDHDCIDFEGLVNFGVPILDTRNVLKKITATNGIIKEVVVEEKPQKRLFTLFHQI